MEIYDSHRRHDVQRARRKEKRSKAKSGHFNSHFLQDLQLHPDSFNQGVHFNMQRVETMHHKYDGEMADSPNQSPDFRRNREDRMNEFRMKQTHF
mmetsp:Transcript_4411/g.6446  ORF Transcript_4411/g.6446 Transcript_4411/m.6446 type:complete len:95 (+) Transcript_4411:1454-1738(+)